MTQDSRCRPVTGAGWSATGGLQIEPGLCLPRRPALHKPGCSQGLGLLGCPLCPKMFPGFPSPESPPDPEKWLRLVPTGCRETISCSKREPRSLKSWNLTQEACG